MTHASDMHTGDTDRGDSGTGGAADAAGATGVGAVGGVVDPDRAVDPGGVVDPDHAVDPGGVGGPLAGDSRAPARDHDHTRDHDQAPARPRHDHHTLTAQSLLSAADLPGWLTPVVRAVETVRPHDLSRFLPPKNGAGRQSAVLVLFGAGEQGPELLLMERASSLRSHAGQPSFPGGALDPEDGDPRVEGPLRAALREAEEETGLDPKGVQLFGMLPRLFIPVSDFVVTPVLGWWRAPSPVGVVDPAETARVFTVPVADLTHPANRATAVHPSGHRGPAFLVESTLVWGFTAGLIDRLLHYAGWERPWDRDRQVPLDWGS